jgi:purine-binding chemotaxis protein CheW
MSIKITSSSIDIEKNQLIEHAPEVIDNEMDDERDNIQKNILNVSECDSEFEQEMPACSEDNGDSLESKEKIETPEFDSYDAIYTDFLNTVKLIPEHCENETLNIDEHNNLFDPVTVEDHDCEGDSNTSKINYRIDDVSDVTQDEAEIDVEIKNHDIVGDQESISSLNHDMSGIDSIEKCKVTRETDHDAEVLTLHNNSDENITSEQLEQSLITDEASNALEEIINSIDNDVKNIYRVENQQSAGSVKQQHYRTTRYLLFTIGKSHYAFTVANILEIALVPTITPLPNVPNWLKGVTNLRGEILSVIDLGLFFEVKNSVKHDDNRLLVVSTEDGEVATSLIVDQVNGFIQLDSSRDSDTSIVFHDKVTPYLSGVFECEGMILATLDLERLLKSSEVCQFN